MCLTILYTYTCRHTAGPFVTTPCPTYHLNRKREQPVACHWERMREALPLDFDCPDCIDGHRQSQQQRREALERLLGRELRAGEQTQEQYERRFGDVPEWARPREEVGRWWGGGRGE
ncbi:MAG: hypothetical protein M1821_006179 [Bathelium mastoideum]|nr:MAG: hypothetical protein M1821_006179 [Bathelium mastoideum]